MKCPTCKEGDLKLFGKFKDYKCTECFRFFTTDKLKELGIK